jgi:hypothetical protein
MKMPHPNKYEDPEERYKLWLSLSFEEREAALKIIAARQKQREEEFYEAKYGAKNSRIKLNKRPY